MKKFFYLFAMALLTATAFTSCSDDDDKGSSNDLIGKWQSVSSEGWEKINGELDDEWSESSDNLLYVFTEDGEFYMYSYYSGKWFLEEQVEYSYKNGIITITDGDVPAEVKKLTSTTLILSTYYKEKYEGDVYEDYEEITFRRADDIEL